MPTRVAAGWLQSVASGSPPVRAACPARRGRRGAEPSKGLFPPLPLWPRQKLSGAVAVAVAAWSRMQGEGEEAAAPPLCWLHEGGTRQAEFLEKRTKIGALPLPEELHLGVLESYLRL